MTPDDIRLLLRFHGPHGMARVASRPDTAIPAWKTSVAGFYGRGERIETKADGVHVTDDAGHRVITWKAIKAHALEHTTNELRGWIDAMDWEWCRATTHAPGFPPARAAICKHWLEHLARIVWDPALVAPPEPEQLDMLAYLEEMTS